MSGPGSRRTRSRRLITDKATKYQIRIYAEGEKTEEGYLTHLWRENREHVAVSIARHVGSTPLKLVSTAVAERKGDLRTARRVGPAYDEYWCVLDVDEHPGLTDALRMAAAGYVSVIGPHCDGAIRPHLGPFDVGVTEVSGPTCDTPGVV